MVVPTNKQKVLLIATNGLGKSGVPSVIMKIVELLNDNFIFDIVVTRKDTFFYQNFKNYGGNIIEIIEKDYKRKLFRIIYKLFIKKFIIKKKMSKILKENSYDIIHSFKDTEGAFYLKLAKKHNIEIRINHFSRIYESPAKKINKMYELHLLKKTYKYSTKLVAISNSVGLSLPYQPQFIVCYNTFDQDRFYFEDKSEFDLCFYQIGTILPLKNQLFSLEVVKEIKEQKYNPIFYIIGNKYDLNYFNKLIDFIDGNNLKSNVVFLDFNCNQKTVLDQCFCSLIPSKNEGLSLVAIEAQACGIKCFASTGVPAEVSCGNIEFLKLDSKLWAKHILNFYFSNSKKRKKVQLEPFTNEIFKRKVEEIYTN